MRLQGTYTAIITPFRDDEIDRPALRALIDRQIEAGITGVVPIGTTGESPTLNMEEHSELVRLVVEEVDGRCQIIAGTGANATSEAVQLTADAEKAGATASLQVCPYYNKPSQEGLYQHFKTIADSTSLPIMLYSVPGRSAIAIAPETVARLAADCKNIIAIKEAGGSVERVNQLVQAVPEDFNILSGDDPLTVPFMSCGATGLVSVAANIIPEVMVKLVNSCRDGDYAQALELQKEWYPLFRTLMSLDTNPVPVKEAAALLGYCSRELRLPMANLPDDKLAQLREQLALHKLI